MLVTRMARDSRIAAREAAAMPFPREETTPPVTNTYFVIYPRRVVASGQDAQNSTQSGRTQSGGSNRSGSMGSPWKASLHQPAGSCCKKDVNRRPSGDRRFIAKARSDLGRGDVAAGQG